MATLITKATKN
jgi:NAD(P)-dependent dehydrogenase (short-subunit alcohol dehydrogenase family)